jgi:energy-coupling factor transporter ATP-binding protein EcfA2
MSKINLENKNMSDKYMVKATTLSRGKQTKILKNLNIDKAPLKAVWGKQFKTKNAWWLNENRLLNVQIQKEKTIKKNKLKEAKKNKYDTTVHFKVDIKRTDKKGNTIISTVPISKRVTVSFTEKKNMKKVMSNIMDEYEDGHDYVVLTQNQEPSFDNFVTKRYRSPKLIMKTKMRLLKCSRESLMTFVDGEIDISTIDSGESECVIDYLVHIYNNENKSPNHRLAKVTRENLINSLRELHNDINNITGKYNKDGKLIKDEFNIKDGISTEQLLYLNEKFIKRNLIGVNCDNKQFIKYQPEVLNQTVKKDIIFMISDNHFFAIEDKSYRRKIQAQAGIVHGRTTVILKKDEYTPPTPEEIEEHYENLNHVINPTTDELLKLENTMVYYDEEDLTPVLLEILNNEHTILDKGLYCNETGLKKIKWEKNNVIIYSNTDYTDVLFNCEKLGYLFINQNLTQLANDYFKHNYNIQKSVFNNEVDEIFHSNHTRTIAFRDCLQTPCVFNEAPIVSMDAVKQYCSALYLNKYEFCIFTAFDDVHEYDGKGILRPGFYEIVMDNEEDSYFPLSGNGFYHYGTLIDAREQLGLKFTVVKQILTPITLPCDYFCEYIDHIRNNCNNSKLMINSFIGCLNKIKSISYEYLFSTDMSQMEGIHFNSSDGIHITSHPFITKQKKEENLFIARKKVEKVFKETHRPIYQQILEQSHIRLALFCKDNEIKKENIIKRSTDCITFYNPENRIFIDNLELGGFRHETNPEDYKINIKEPRTEIYEIPNKEWDMIDDVNTALENNNGFLLTGLPGSGKTFIAKLIIKKLNEMHIPVVICATTNAAARLIPNCQTVHKALGLDHSCKMVSTLPDDKFLPNSYFIIDECSQISGDLYQLLFTLKKTRNIKFILIGDSHQLPAVETISRDYSNCDLLKYLCDNNKKLLTTNRRSCDVMWNIYNEIINDIEVKQKFKKTNKLLQTELNICLSNKMRTEINNAWMNKMSLKAKKVFVHQNVDDDDNEKVYSEMKIYKGLPLICKVNNQKLEIFNNESFRVHDFNVQKQIVKITNSENKIIEITFKDLNTFQPGYARTCHVAQGQSYDQPYTIFEWNHHFATKEWKLVAISRTTEKNNIFISTAKPTDSIHGKIYKIINTINKKIYIGSTITTIKNRFEGHLVDSENGRGKLYKAMKKLGKENFKIELIKSIKVANHSDLFELENEFIKSHKSIEFGYNSIGSYRNKH